MKNDNFIFECVMAHFVRISYNDFKKYKRYFSHVLILNKDVITVLKSSCFSVVDKNDVLYCDKYTVDEYDIKYLSL